MSRLVLCLFEDCGTPLCRRSISKSDLSTLRPKSEYEFWLIERRMQEYAISRN
jgi:hypothetical protein